MFKRFTVEESVSSTSQVKNSVQRAIQAQIIQQYPLLEPLIDQIIPKKLMMLARCQDHIQLVVVNNEVVFFNIRDGPFYPSLKLVHKCKVAYYNLNDACLDPNMMPRLQVDKGAIRFILGGANIMCPGFTSKGGWLPDSLDAETPVAIYAEGKQHALGIGLTKMSVQQIREINKDIAVESIHHLGDGLWQIDTL